MVMYKPHSPVLQSQNPLKHNIVQKLAVAAGVALSLGLINAMPPEANRFEFKQQVGDHQLSGVFEGTDKDADGVLELSELDSFQANWGNYSWTKDDLEVFSWGEKEIGQNQGQTYGMNGLNLFARGSQQVNTSALQVWNRGLSTQSKNQGVSAIEYAANTPDNTLFSAEKLPVTVSQAQSPVDVSALMALLLVGMTGLLILNPCWFEVNTPDGKPCNQSKM
ncbi:MAG: hypothetical protein AAFO04_12430 [Cyanobacteria bacterium J06592_8]